jgi:hypothetical protein
VDATGKVLYEDAAADLVDIDVKQDDDNWMFWLITCTYDTEGVDPDKANKDPLLKTPDVEFGNFLTKTALETDQSLHVICNSAGDPYIPPLQEDTAYTTLVVVQNEAAFDPIQAQKYRFTTNATTWKTCSAGQALCRPIGAKRHWERGKRFWVVRYEIHIADTVPLGNDGKPVFWRRRLLDRGKRNIPAATPGVPVPNTTGGVPAGEVLLDGHGGLLNGTGRVLSVGDPGYPGASPVYIDYVTKKTSEFSELPIGDIGV